MGGKKKYSREYTHPATTVRVEKSNSVYMVKIIRPEVRGQVFRIPWSRKLACEFSAEEDGR